MKPSATKNVKSAAKTSAKKTAARKPSVKAPAKKPVLKKPVQKNAVRKPSGKAAAAQKRAANAPVKKPAVKKPAVKKQLVSKPGVSKTAAKAPAKKVVSKKVTVKKPVRQSAAPTKLAAKKPAAKSLVAKRPAVKQVAGKKPAAKAPVKKAAPKKAPAKQVANKPLAKKAAASSFPVKSKTSESAARPAAPATAKNTQRAPVVQAAALAKPARVSKKSNPIPPTFQSPNPATLAELGMPVRTGRPSSRLVQLTVPSISQSVASTGAKASFTPHSAVQPVATPAPVAVKKNRRLADNWTKKPVEQLSDEEVIAMSDDLYMNDVQLAFFRLKLLSLKSDILNNADKTTETLRSDTVIVPDPADRATIEEEHALELRTRDRERKLLKKIEQSIAMIDAGEYGYCDETGEPIGVGRLMARPTATLSLEAQQRRELKQKMFGD